MKGRMSEGSIVQLVQSLEPLSHQFIETRTSSDGVRIQMKLNVLDFLVKLFGFGAGGESFQIFW